MDGIDPKLVNSTVAAQCVRLSKVFETIGTIFQEKRPEFCLLQSMSLRIMAIIVMLIASANAER